MATTSMIGLFVLFMSMILSIGEIKAYEKTEREILSREKKDSAGLIFEKTEREILSKEKRDNVGSIHEKIERVTTTHETRDDAGPARVKTQSEKSTYEKQDNEGRTREKTYTEKLTQEKTNDDKSSDEKIDNLELTSEKIENVTSTREKIDSLRLAATRNAISIAIREISNTEKFINDIPWLHTFELSDSTALVNCIAGLTKCLGEGQSKLRRMQHLDQATLPFVDSDVEALKSAVLSRVASFDGVCRIGLKKVDKTVAVMVYRKLEDVKLLANNVIKYVSQLNLNTLITFSIYHEFVII